MAAHRNPVLAAEVEDIARRVIQLDDGSGVVAGLLVERLRRLLAEHILRLQLVAERQGVVMLQDECLRTLCGNFLCRDGAAELKAVVEHILEAGNVLFDLVERCLRQREIIHPEVRLVIALDVERDILHGIKQAEADRRKLHPLALAGRLGQVVVMLHALGIGILHTELAGVVPLGLHPCGSDIQHARLAEILEGNGRAVPALIALGDLHALVTGMRLGSRRLDDGSIVVAALGEFGDIPVLKAGHIDFFSFR